MVVVSSFIMDVLYCILSSVASIYPPKTANFLDPSGLPTREEPVAFTSFQKRSHQATVFFVDKFLIFDIIKIYVARGIETCVLANTCFPKVRAQKSFGSRRVYNKESPPGSLYFFTNALKRRFFVFKTL